MRWTLVLLLLLSACATQRQAGSDEEAIPATRQVPKLYAPAIYTKPTIRPTRSTLSTYTDMGEGFNSSSSLSRAGIPYVARPAIPYAPAQSKVTTRTVYLRDTLAIDSLGRELQIEQLANQAIRKRLDSAESDRDYWQEKNEQKFWTLIAMAVFAFLYILFRVLASRIKET